MQELVVFKTDINIITKSMQKYFVEFSGLFYELTSYIVPICLVLFGICISIYGDVP